MTQCNDDTQKSATTKNVGGAPPVASGSPVATTTRACVAGTALARSVRGVIPRGVFVAATQTTIGVRAARVWPVRGPTTRRSFAPANARRRGGGSGRRAPRRAICSTSPLSAAKYSVRRDARDAAKHENFRHTIPTTIDHFLSSGFVPSATVRSTARSRTVIALPWVWVISFRKVAP